LKTTPRRSFCGEHGRIPFGSILVHRRSVGARLVPIISPNKVFSIVQLGTVFVLEEYNTREEQMSRAGVEPDPDGEPPPCEERDLLFLQYRNAVRDWVAAINRLDAANANYDQRLTDRIEETRFRALTAKAMYHNHIDQHGCEI
jgi:hypothetical protein